MREIFLLVPSFRPTGPVKGAVALANALAGSRKVTLVSIKHGPGVEAPVDPRVLQVSLADAGVRRVAAYRKLLRGAGGRDAVASISGCLSADMLNALCRDVAVTCASVRGNLVENYRIAFRPIGVPIAVCHLTSLRRMDAVVAMSSAMSRQIARYIRREPAVIGNFIDEVDLEGYVRASQREGPLRFVFLGSLIELKRPMLAVDAVAELLSRGVDARLDVVGDGALWPELVRRIAEARLTDRVMLHGYVARPFDLLSTADAMVLPSVSEGTPRAALEALHLRVPCVLRDTDGHGELIEEGVNGALFQRDIDLPAAMRMAGELGRNMGSGGSLLPHACRQATAARQYLELVEAV